MIKHANDNNEDNKIRFVEMNSEKIEFPKEFFDIITARHTPFNLEEVYKALKEDGLFFSEQIDEDDCKELKEQFGRGQGYNVQSKLIDKIKSNPPHPTHGGVPVSTGARRPDKRAMAPGHHKTGN